MPDIIKILIISIGCGIFMTIGINIITDDFTNDNMKNLIITIALSFITVFIAFYINI